MIKKILLTVIILGLGAYFVAAISLLNKPSDNEVCTAVSLTVNDSIRAGFINTKEVEQILKANKLYPINQRIAEINTRKIEETLKKNPFISDAQCFRSATGKICIEVSQRLPILRILSNDGENCYLDAHGHKMTSAGSIYSVHLPVVTGHVTADFARKNLLALGQYIQDDEFWDNMIEQIHVTDSHNLEMVPRVGDHIIYLGKPDQLEDKLDRLKIFYEKGLNKIGWNKYSRINMEFSNQIICTKK